LQQLVELGRQALGEQTINLQILPVTFCAKGRMSQEFLGLSTVSLWLVSLFEITAGFSSLDIHPKASSSCSKMFESTNFLYYEKTTNQMADYIPRILSCF
jgi:hypothetical protein